MWPAIWDQAAVSVGHHGCRPPGPATASSGAHRGATKHSDPQRLGIELCELHKLWELDGADSAADTALGSELDW